MPFQARTYLFIFFNSTPDKNSSVSISVIAFYVIELELLIQSILKFLQLIPDFLARGNTVGSSVYVFPVVSVREVFTWTSI